MPRQYNSYNRLYFELAFRGDRKCSRMTIALEEGQCISSVIPEVYNACAWQRIIMYLNFLGWLILLVFASSSPYFKILGSHVLVHSWTAVEISAHLVMPMNSRCTCNTNNNLESHTHLCKWNSRSTSPAVGPSLEIQLLVSSIISLITLDFGFFLFISSLSLVNRILYSSESQRSFFGSGSSSCTLSLLLSFFYGDFWTFHVIFVAMLPRKCNV